MVLRFPIKCKLTDICIFLCFLCWIARLKFSRKLLNCIIVRMSYIILSQKMVWFWRIGLQGWPLNCEKVVWIWHRPVCVDLSCKQLGIEESLHLACKMEYGGIIETSRGSSIALTSKQKVMRTADEESGKQQCRGRIHHEIDPPRYIVI